MTAIKNNYLLLAKKEATAGTIEPLDGSNAIETVEGVKVNEYDGDYQTRAVDGVAATAGEEVNTKPRQSFDFRVDLAGSGNPVNSVAFAMLLEACGFVRTVDATPGDEKEIFTLDNNVESPTVTLGRHVGNKKFNASAGCRGNVSFSFDGYIGMAFNFLGSYARPAASPFPASIVFDNYAAPLPVNSENTQLCQLDGEDIIMHGLSISAGSGVQMVNVPGQKQARHDRLFASGQITILQSEIGEKDWFERVESHNGVVTVPFDFQHGKVAGNRVRFQGQVQLSQPSESSINGEEAYQFNMTWQNNLVITLS